MKLLPKKQIASQVASQSKAQIDEGVLIAKKVDALRQTLASLEKQHNEFADRVQVELREQVKDLVSEIEYRKRELAEFLEKRAKALEPLDMAWAEVRAKTSQIDATLDDITSRNKKIQIEEAKAVKRSKEAKDSAYRISVREKELERAYVVADQLKSDADKLLRSTEEACSLKIKEADYRLREIDRKEKEVSYAQKYIEGVKARQDEREKELNDKERQINDKYATLERTIKRLSK